MATASIYSQYLRPAKSMGEYAQEYDAAEGNALALAAKRMQMQQSQRAMADEDAIRGLARQHGGDENALIRALRTGGYFDKAGAIEKSIGERLKAKSDLDTADATRRKTEAETESKRLADAKTRLDLAGQVFGFVRDNPSLENGARAADYLAQNGIWTREQAQAAIQQLQQNPTPEAIRSLAALSFQSALDAKEQLPKYFQQSRGGTTAVVGVNPVTGEAKDLQTATLTQTPDSVASNARMVEEGRLNRGVTMRGQNMADARARESTAATLTKPFEVTGPDGTPMLVQQDKQGNIRPVQGYGPKLGSEKPLNDTQSKALLFGSRMREADKVLESLAKAGTTTSIPGARAGYGIGATLNALSSSQQQQLNQAKRDFVNAVLRRESGAVISDSEFANAEQQYFPQINEGREVIAQKARNRRLAIDGILAEVPSNRRDSLKPQEALPSADDVRKQADAILKGG